MAAHTPEIGLIAIVRYSWEEWRVSGRECGLRELVKFVGCWTEVDVRASGVTLALPAKTKGPCARAVPGELRPQRPIHGIQVKGDNTARPSRPRQSARPDREGMISQTLRASSSPQPHARRHLSTTSSRAHYFRRHPSHRATTSSLCQASSTPPAPAVWAYS
jgi:hypothetical protein